MGLDAHVGVQRGEPLARHVDLRAPDVGGAVEDLALEVREVDHVRVDEAERADARGGEVLRRGAAEPAGADQDDAPAQQASCPSGPISARFRWRR